jgi:hypothetical protein
MNIGTVGLRGYDLLERLYAQGPIAGGIVRRDKPGGLAEKVRDEIIDDLVRLLVLPGGAVAWANENAEVFDRYSRLTYPVSSLLYIEAALIEFGKILAYAYAAEKLLGA